VLAEHAQALAGMKDIVLEGRSQLSSRLFSMAVREFLMQGIFSGFITLSSQVFDSVHWYQLRAPSIRLFSGEWVGKHKSKRHEIMPSKT